MAQANYGNVRSLAVWDSGLEVFRMATTEMKMLVLVRRSHMQVGLNLPISQIDHDI